MRSSAFLRSNSRRLWFSGLLAKSARCALAAAASARLSAALPKPHRGDGAGGAGSRSALGARKLTTVPLQSARIASLFSTCRCARDVSSQDQGGRYNAGGVGLVRSVGGYFCAGAMRPRLQHWAVTETGSIELRAWSSSPLRHPNPAISPRRGSASRFCLPSAMP